MDSEELNPRVVNVCKMALGRAGRQERRRARRDKQKTYAFVVRLRR